MGLSIHRDGASPMLNAPIVELDALWNHRNRFDGNILHTMQHYIGESLKYAETLGIDLDTKLTEKFLLQLARRAKDRTDMPTTKAIDMVEARKISEAGMWVVRHIAEHRGRYTTMTVRNAISNFCRAFFEAHLRKDYDGPAHVAA